MHKKIAGLLYAVVVSALILNSCSGATPISTSPTLEVQVDQTQVAPRIIAQQPIAGGRLELDAPLEFTFDRDMNRDKTSRAFSLLGPDDEPVPGKAAWSDARTFIFTPDKRLKPGTTYKAIFSTSASSADGESLKEEIQIKITTVEALAVAQVFPAEDAEGVDMATNITVIFNHPIVPVTIEEEQDSLPQPLVFSPPVAGTGNWVNSTVYVFEPEEALLSGTSYTVRVDAGLRDVTGKELDRTFLWKFTTRAPSIANFALKNGPQNPQEEIQNVLLNQAFIVTFLQPMDQKSTAGAVTLVNRESGKPFPLKFKWNKDSTVLTIEPVGRYQIAGFYDLNISDSALAQDGGRLKEGLTVKFSTVPLPQIVSVFPEPNSKKTEFNSYFLLKFASPMDFDSLKSRVRISPQPKNELRFYYSEHDWQLYVYGLEPSTDYVVRVLPGMTDIYGHAIQSEYSFAFTTAQRAPFANLLLPWTPLVYRAHGTQDVFFEYTNLDSGTVTLYSITFDEFRGMLKGDVNTAFFHPSANPVNEWKVDTNTPRNEVKRVSFDLKDPRGNPLAPGYYFIGVRGEPLRYDGTFHQGHLLIVATDNITFKATDSEGLAWVVDLESGEPQAGVPVKFYDQYYNEVGAGKTDKDGGVYIDKINSPVFARVEGTNHIAFAALDWGSGVSAGDFGLYESYYSDTDRPFAYLYTDRPIYRPGQDVCFKGIVRRNDDLHYSLYDKTRVHVTIDHFGEQVYAEYLTLSDLGSFTDKFTLDENAAIGSYDIYVRFSPSEDPFGFLSFNVAEYHKPEFEVLAGADKTGVLPGETVNFSVDAKYYSGGNVANAGVKWFLEAVPFYFRPSSKYNQFSFSDWDRDVYWSSEENRTLSTLAEGEAVTDENGHLDLSQILNLLKSKTSQTVSFKANVEDVAGNLVSGGTSVVVHQSQVYAGIRSEKYVGLQGEEQLFEVVALDWDSNPLAGQRVTVQFVERRWYSVQEKDKQGQLRWVTSVKEIPVGTQSVVTDEDGKAVVSFIPPNGGVFKALVTVQDSKGNKHQASTYLWVSSEEYVAWRQTNDRTFSLVADKETYSPGDTAEILIAQPFESEVYALVTYERGHIYKQDVVLLKGSSTIYRIPITGDMAPMAFVSVTVVAGAEDFGKPNFKIGMVKLNIETSEKELDVTVTTDKNTAGPGDEVVYNITTKDADGKPVSADVSLAVVDKAVLALVPPNSARLLDAFYPDQALGVRTALGIVSSADDFNAQYREPAIEGGGSGGGGGGEFGIITVRQEFKDTAYFAGMITTDEKGTAQITVTLPENLTTWQADVRAVTADSRVGQTTQEVISTKPIFVELQTPRFFVVGDEVTLGAIIHNNTNNARKVNVSLEAEGVTLNDEAAKSIEVPAGGQAYVTWEVTVNNDVQRVDLTIHAASGTYRDSSKPALGTLEGQGIPVYNFTAVETVGTSGMLTDANSATEGIQLPTSINYTDADLSIEVSPSLAASVQDGLTYLEQYPYLCIEQTVSRFLPNVITTRALEAAGLSDPELKKNLDAQVNAALQRIYAKQLYDGGWNWWDGEQSDPYVSAYVVYGLIEAKESGYRVSESVLATGLEYLRNNLPNLRRNDAAWQYNRHAFMLYVLARANQLRAGQTNYIYEHRTSLGLYGKAYLAQAIHLLDPEDKRIASLMSDLASATVMSASGAHWEEALNDYWNWNTDTRTTAIVLNAFVQVEPESPITANAVRWLMAHRTAGHWESTQETAWSLIALTNWLSASNEFETDYQFAVGLNGDLLEEGKASKDNLKETTKLQIELKDLLKEQVNYLVFTRGEGTGNLYYTAYLNATLPVEEIQPLDQGAAISREYFTLDDPKHPITEIERGELVRVRLTMILPAALHYVVIDDPLPAGFEAVDASLNTSTQVPLSYTREDFIEHGWGWWYFPHSEIRDEKVVLSADYLPAGTYVYTYIARASTAGTFKVIPPTMSEFYFPDVGGRGAGSMFVVKP
jgi:hypothetical protein